MENLSLNRRQLLIAAGGTASLAVLDQLTARPAHARGGGRRGNPFTLGVASGDPAPDGVVLWTRLAPDPLAPGGGMPDRAVRVQWQVARDERMRHVVARGTEEARPELGHSVHAELRCLQPDREYFYRFRAMGEVSAVGRTRTTPQPWAEPAGLAFAFASCQDWQSGYYTPYRHMAEDDLDFVLHLGDYVYENAIPADGGLRGTPVPDHLQTAPRDLDRWRTQYALYKSDPDLQRVHQRFPWIVTWDDHEVLNDYAETRTEEESDIGALRAVAYQAWYEHQPVRRRTTSLTGPQVYQRLEWGGLVQLDVLDGRQYRDVPPCGWGEAQACEAAYDPAISMLGEEQERWLMEGLAASTARWNVLGNNVMMGRLDHDGAAGDLLWHDAWDGFPAARNRITNQFVDAGVRNPVIVTGDWHSTFVNDVKRDFDDPASPVVATEFVGTSISTNGDTPVYGPYYGPMIQHNPHIRFFDGDRRGYVRCQVGEEEWRSDLRMVESVSRPDAPAYTLASFVVEDGRPGAVQV